MLIFVFVKRKILFKMKKLTALKILGLVIGCAAKFTTGSLFVFSVYQDALKDTFNYTQKEVELLSSMLNFGLGVGFLPGMFYDHFGPQWTSVVGLFVSVSSYLLIWSSTKAVSFYSSKAWLMSIYFFICGLGSIFTYMVALNTNIINFDKKDTGKIVGLLNAFFAGSPSVFAALYYHVFSHGDTTDVSNQDFPGFMLLFAISFAIVDILSILFVKIYKDESQPFVRFVNVEDDKSNTNEIVTSSNSGGSHEIFCFARRNGRQSIIGDINGDSNTDNVTITNNDAERHMSVKEILLNADYEILIWTISFASVIGLVYTNNITVISGSLHLDKYNDRLTLIIPITNAVVSFLVGIISDYFKDRFPRMWILILGCTCYTASQILVFFLAGTLDFLVISAVLVGFGTAIVWSMSPTIMKEMFYVGNLGRNWGIALLVASLLGFGIQEAFGAFYDDKISPGGDGVHCYGMKCIRGGTLICLACGSVSIALGIFMRLRKKCCNR